MAAMPDDIRHEIESMYQQDTAAHQPCREQSLHPLMRSEASLSCLSFISFIY